MNSAKFYFSIIYTSVLFLLSLYLVNSREAEGKPGPSKNTSPKVDYILNYDYGELGNADGEDDIDDSVAEDGIRVGKDGFSIQDSSCTPPGGMVFLKKHKSASSTLQTVAKNFCRYYSMPGESPPVGSVSGGYPGPFQPEFLGSPRHPKPYAISTHQVFNLEVEKAIFPENAFFLTSVREPLSLFRSMFEYFYRRWDSEAAVRNRKCGFTCWGAPYAHWLAEEADGGVRFGAEISEYLDRLPKIFNKSAPWAFRAKNFQAFELGLDWTRDDKKYVSGKLNELAKAFDLVVLSEYYYESLVLLRERLCLPWQAMYARSRMVSKPYTKEPFTSSQSNTLKKFYAQDFQIYKYFNQTLQKKITTYGRARMSHDARKLRQMYALCDKQPKRCSFSRPQAAKMTKGEPVDNSVVNTSALVEYMEAHQGSCEWGAFAKLKANEPTGCGQDEILFPNL